MKKFLFVFTSLIITNVFSQNSNFELKKITDDVIENSNAVINSEKTKVIVNSIDEMLYTNERIITVFNEIGLHAIESYQHYDKSTSIKKLEVSVLNNSGKSIQKYTKKDFNDNIVVDDVSFVTDDRVLSFNFKPFSYPVKLKVTREIKYSNTAFIPSWIPISDFQISILKSEYEFVNNSGIDFKIKEVNFDKWKVKKIAKSNTINYSIVNCEPVKKEMLMPELIDIVPAVKFALIKFNIEGVKGNNESWKLFGQWMNNSLLNQIGPVPESTIKQVSKLLVNVDNPLDKAKIIYEFMQNKTRYVGIQLGIGGWKPMSSKDVDNLGYGDCKALTCYTKKLLEAFGVESYYTIVYANQYKKNNIDSSFVSMQGNHAILTLPYNNKNYFIECTSQTSPFGYINKMTDDRIVLLVNENGGELIKTDAFTDEENRTIYQSNIKLHSDNSIDVNFIAKSYGYNYSTYQYFYDMNENEAEKYYKNRFSQINNFKLNEHEHVNNKNMFEFIEKISFSSQNYVQNYGNDIVLSPNILNMDINVPIKEPNRKYPFQIVRGSVVESEFTINIPENYIVNDIPNTINLDSKFGNYKLSFLKKTNNLIVFNRVLKINSGKYEKEDYELYRKFMEKIYMSDNLKILMNKKQ